MPRLRQAFINLEQNFFMSGADFEAMDTYDRGLSIIPNKYCCYRHIDETAVQSFIKSKAKSGKCDYCYKQAKLLGLICSWAI